MSEPNPGLPAPSGQPTGITPTPGQPQPAPNPAPQPAANPQAAPASIPPAQPPVDAAKLQRELEESQRYNRALQSQKDQAEARLRAMAGVAAPAPDPLDAKAAAYAKQFNIDPADARVFVGMMQAETAPLIQRNQHLEAQIQGGSVAQQAMQAAVSANPELFSDPTIANEVWNSMQSTAQQGNLQVLTPEYAKFLGAQAWALKNEPWKQPNAPQPPAPIQGFRPAGLPPISFGGAPGHYPPPAPNPANVPNPQVAALAAEMAKYTGIPLAPQS